MNIDVKFFIWSNNPNDYGHSWIGPDGGESYKSKFYAGQFTAEQAVMLCAVANRKCLSTDQPKLVMVPVF